MSEQPEAVPDTDAMAEPPDHKAMLESLGEHVRGVATEMLAHADKARNAATDLLAKLADLRL